MEEAQVQLVDMQSKLARQQGLLNDALVALQDALVCLDGSPFREGEVIYEADPYSMQKRAVRAILEFVKQ